MESLNAYAQKLDSALENQEPYTSYNRDMAHAKVIVCTAMRYAKQHVRLLSNKLDPLLYASSWYVQETEGFLARGGRLQILVETDVEAAHPVRVMNRDSDKVDMKRVPTDQVESYKFNFMVVDDIGCRFESDREEPKAFVTFNDKAESCRELVERLSEIFEYLDDVSEVVPA